MIKSIISLSFYTMKTKLGKFCSGYKLHRKALKHYSLPYSYKYISFESA